MRQDIKERIEMINRGEVPEGYKRSELGIVPIDWKIKELGDFVTDMKSGLSRKLDDNDIGLPVIRSNNILNNKINFGDLKYWYINDPQGAKTVDYIIDDGDILVNFINSEAQIGKTAIYRSVLGRDVIFTTNILKMKINQKMNTQYFLFYSQSSRYDKYVKSITKPAINQASFTTVEFKKLLLPIPSDKEQFRISDILLVWDHVIELKEKLLEQKKLQKKALLQRLLTGKKRLPGFNGKWQTLKAGEIFMNVTDKTHGGVGEILSSSQEKGIIPRNQIEIDIKFNPESVISYKKVDIGDFVISLRSFQGGIEYSGYEGLVSPAYTVLKSRLPIDKGFYKELFKSQSFIKRLNSVIYGIRDGKQIGYDDFCMLKLPYPPLDEQRIISKVLETAECEIRCIQQELEHLKLQKKGLMQLLLTGKVRTTI